MRIKKLAGYMFLHFGTGFWAGYFFARPLPAETEHWLFGVNYPMWFFGFFMFGVVAGILNFYNRP